MGSKAVRVDLVFFQNRDGVGHGGEVLLERRAHAQWVLWAKTCFEGIPHCLIVRPWAYKVATIMCLSSGVISGFTPNQASNAGRA